MPAEVIRLHAPPTDEDHQRLVTAISELHALITIDPVLGASPVRTYFVLNPQAQARIAQTIARAERSDPRQPSAYALVAYDFPLALFQFQGTASAMPEARAKAIINCSADLQGDTLVAAAQAMGLHARRIAAFDADALKSVFFPDTQETVIHLLQVWTDAP